MSRLARIIVPGIPHHVTQRGNRREAIFFRDGDQDVYRALLAEQARKHGGAVSAYCLMPNHVHLILTPSDSAGLGRAVGEAHRRYTNFVNARGGWTGHLLQSRFASVAMDEGHLMAAVRYVSLNPVRARLVARAEAWPWSSVRAHLAGADDRGLALEDERNQRPRGDEADQLLVERLALVLGVMLGGQLAADGLELERHQAQALALEAGDDLSAEVAGEGIRLDEDERSLHGGGLLQIGSEGFRWSTAARRRALSFRAAGAADAESEPEPRSRPRRRGRPSTWDPAAAHTSGTDP